MNFTVYERLMLLQTLPPANQYGTFLHQKVLRDLMNELGFNEQEQADWKMEQGEGGRITWDIVAAEDKEIECGPVCQRLIANAMRFLDERAMMEVGLLDLCERVGYAGLPEPEEEPEEEGTEE